MRRSIWKGLSIAFGFLAGCPAENPGPTDYTGLPADYDEDHDGYDELNGDCDDADSTVFPGATEICDDAIDNDCDNVIDTADRDCADS